MRVLPYRDSILGRARQLMLRGGRVLAFVSVLASQSVPAQDAARERSEQNGGQRLSTFGTIFSENCAVCHGEHMEGAPQGTPLMGVDLIHDDGRIPVDNPFIEDPNAGNTIWTYGHRSPQGLEFNNRTRQLWGTEHGPRGGDEVNLLLPGRNYGWPLYSKGQNYNGSKVEWGKEFGIEFELEDIEQPVVDMTPSPAISSFVFYDGAAFPAWRGNIIVGSLKAADVYRIEIEDNKFSHKELLIENLARIRDVEVGPQGEIYLLLEHASGAQIVRVVPAG
jgi:glucose/arabinose dehydrogenase